MIILWSFVVIKVTCGFFHCELFASPKNNVTIKETIQNRTVDFGARITNNIAFVKKMMRSNNVVLVFTIHIEEMIVSESFVGMLIDGI